MLVATPVIGTDPSTPTSAEVHLFSDPHTYNQERPNLYADCEGFKGGNNPPVEAIGWSPKTWKMDAIKAFGKELVMGDGFQFSRQWAVGNLYPRFLFAFSDTICYVTKNFRYGQVLLAVSY